MSAIGILFSTLLVLAFSQQQAPYLDLGKAGAGFYGEGRELPDPPDLTSVRVGVLGPGKTGDGLQLRTAVRIALDEANQRGGYHSQVHSGTQAGKATPVGTPRGIPYEMVFREDDGPWGVAARQVVQLAYDEQVWAVIGGLDGMTTHLAELVVSKAWVPVISPSATDSSISYANVPWVFRVAPADSRQADALLEFAERRGYRHLVVLSEVSREAHTGYLRLRESAARRLSSIDLHLEYSPLNPEEIVGRVASTRMDALILWGKAKPALRLLLALRKAGVSAPVLGASDLATSDFSGEGSDLGDVVVSSLCNLAETTPEIAAFREKFEKLTGEAPSAVALYSYDVARLVVAAIQKGGLNRARIRDRLTETSFSGVTGNITFDMLGGNEASPVLLRLQRNRWVRLE